MFRHYQSLYFPTLSTETPRGSGICQRLNGLYADRDHGCEKYFNCGGGTPYPTACPGGLVFDDLHKYCREATAEDRQKCVQEPLVLSCGGGQKTGYSQTTCSTFKCPLITEYPFGDHARYPNPADCKSFIICLRDGSASVKGCPGDMIFSNVQYVCVNGTQTNECYDPVHAREEFLPKLV
uniref:Chitin-binding type-2 domain-containing protein n=1 Tax=Cacopsylla melanoneura TaxID=428564 RepID=A0A8D9E402_9HEMI